MNWSGVLERYGWREDVVGNEPFYPLSLQAAQARAQGMGVVRISANVGMSHDYGNVKVGFVVSIECVQQETAMNMAGEVAFLKALELTNDAARTLGLSELGTS